MKQETRIGTSIEVGLMDSSSFSQRRSGEVMGLEHTEFWEIDILRLLVF